MTSHDVVSRVRKVLKIKKVGHAGTLDPLATGVLVVCLGRATRLSSYLTSQRKRYRALIRLGVETDTLDADGDVVATSDGLPESAGMIEDAIASFRGRQSQMPPMYSARKVGGFRLYKLARKGHQVERKPHEIVIQKLEILAYDAPFLDLDVVCSKGTYVRSLASDIGRSLGCGGSVEKLRRTESGEVRASQCLSLASLDERSAEAVLVDPVIALQELDSCVLDCEDLHRFSHGSGVDLDVHITSPCKVIDQVGQFWGIGRVDPPGRLMPECVLRQMEPSSEAHPA